MLAREYRLRANNDFNKCYSGGRPKHGSFIMAKIKPNNLQNSRFGVVVSKKVAKKAHQRNRLKRQITEIIRNNVDLSKKLDYVLVVKQGALNSSPQDLKQDIMALIN